jgi:uncharacterized membrane protein
VSSTLDTPAPAAAGGNSATLGERAEAWLLNLPGRIRALPYFAPLAVVAVTFLVNAGIVVVLWGRLGYGAFDLTIFDQAVRNYSQFHLPHVPVKGAYAGTGVDFLQLGDHFSPINALAAPLYWIWSDVRMLLFLQAALYAAAAGVIWSSTKDALGRTAANFVGVVFGLSWGIQEASLVGYHELDWAVLIIPLALRRLQLGRPRQALAVACCLFLVKEEMGLIVAVFGFLLWLRGERRLGVIAAVTGVVWSAIAIVVLVPKIGGIHNQYWSYNSLGKNPKQAALHVVAHPLSTVHLLVSNTDKQDLLLWLLAVSVGACLLSPIALLVVPPLLLRMLSDTATYSEPKFHYNAPLMGILLLAGVEGVAKVMRWLDDVEAVGVLAAASAGSDETELEPEPVPVPVAAPMPNPEPDDPNPFGPLSKLFLRTWLTAITAVAVIGVQYHGYDTLSGAGDPTETAFRSAAKTAVTMIPKDATVEAESAVAVLLSARTRNLILAEPGKPHGSRWVVLGESSPIDWPWVSAGQVEKARKWYLAHGYETRWSRDGVYVLYRTGPVPTGIDNVWGQRPQ